MTQSGKYDIVSAGTDSTGKYIDLDDAAPVDGITVDEASGTVTFHDGGESTVEKALRQLVAIERDRLLGYPHSELHMDPSDALQNGVKALEKCGHDVDDVVLPDDQQALGVS